MRLPQSISAALAPDFGAPQNVVPASGGMMNRAARVQFQNATLFVKWNDAPASNLYAAEAQGLQTLRASQFVVPALAAQTAEFLALHWLPSAPPTPKFGRAFAEKLVALHRAPAGEKFGWEHDNFLGRFAQANAWDDSWPRFYARNRLEPLIELARQNGVLPPQRNALLRRVIENLDALCAGMDARPSLIHGDLWAGNYLALADNQVALFDPAIYFAPREMELAYIELFGGFPAHFSEIYRELWPLPDGYEKRRALWQLYPLLVHLIAFGETYGAPLERACLDALL